MAFRTSFMSMSASHLVSRLNLQCWRWDLIAARPPFPPSSYPRSASSVVWAPAQTLLPYPSPSWALGWSLLGRPPLCLYVRFERVAALWWDWCGGTRGITFWWGLEIQGPTVSFACIHPQVEVHIRHYRRVERTLPSGWGTANNFNIYELQAWDYIIHVHHRNPNTSNETCLDNVHVRHQIHCKSAAKPVEPPMLIRCSIYCQARNLPPITVPKRAVRRL